MSSVLRGRNETSVKCFREGCGKRVIIPWKDPSRFEMRSELESLGWRVHPTDPGIAVCPSCRKVGVNRDNG